MVKLSITMHTKVRKAQRRQRAATAARSSRQAVRLEATRPCNLQKKTSSARLEESSATDLASISFGLHNGDDRLVDRLPQVPLVYQNQVRHLCTPLGVHGVVWQICGLVFLGD